MELLVLLEQSLEDSLLVQHLTLASRSNLSWTLLRARISNNTGKNNTVTVLTLVDGTEVSLNPVKNVIRLRARLSIRG